MTTGFDESSTESELRRALAERAAQVRPSDRLDAILREASLPEVGGHRARWATGLAVAATAAVVAGAVWAARPADDGNLPAGPPTPTTPAPTASITPSGSSGPSATTSPSPTAAPSSTDTARPQPTDTASPAAPSSATGALAVYRVGGNGGVTDRAGLVREFWTSGLGRATDAQRVEAAVGEAMRRTEAWLGVRVTRAAVSDDRITLDLSSSGSADPDADTARLAVAALVWTALAAVGRGDLPVELNAGDGPLLGRIDPSRAFTRSSTPADALCDIWIDTPSPSASVGSSRPVVVRGQAVAWEATVEWELRDASGVVRDGFTTASIGAPARGTFTVDLGRLSPGTWTFRAFTTSAQDGIQVLAEREVTFEVR